MNRPWYICTDDSRLQGRLLAGCAYKALAQGESCFSGNPKPVPAINVRCTDGVERWYPLTRFRTASEAELKSLRNPESWISVSLDALNAAADQAKRHA